MDFLHELILINREYISKQTNQRISEEDTQKIQIKLTRKYLLDEYQMIIQRFENKNYALNSIHGFMVVNNK
tara:strand:- start:46 stop:258 length:213 start_codon:yes stop_codon:yes gene_type:complete